MDRITEQKINKEMEVLMTTKTQCVLDIYRTMYTSVAEDIFLSSGNGIVFRKDNMLGHKERFWDFFFGFLVLWLFRLRQCHMEVPRLGIESELNAGLCQSHSNGRI